MEPHPLESVFNIEPGSTPIVTTASASVTNEILDPATGEIIVRKTENVTTQEIEKEDRIEDLKIDGQIDTIHTAAMNAFQSQFRMSQEVDPKFSARNAEVAAQFLKVALDTVNSRVDAKFKRKKIQLAATEGPRSLQQNLVVADRNDILKNLFGEMEKKDESAS